MENTNLSMQLSSERSSTQPIAPEQEPQHSIDALAHELAVNVGRDPSNQSTLLHPCVIDGKQSLVYERGLAQDKPDVFSYLQSFAQQNAIRLKEDQRCASEPVDNDCRGRWAPVLALAASMLATGAAPVAAQTLAGASGSSAASERVDTVRYGTSDHLPYKDAGQRYMAEPHGAVTNVLQVAADTWRHGKRSTVPRGELAVPNSTFDQTITRYEYSYPENCGGHSFTYYEGKNFKALGHHQGDKVVVDMLMGGGPYIAPRLWGPFDQVLNDSVEMHLLVGNGQNDNFGLMKASYTVGLIPDLSPERRESMGSAYTVATDLASNCELEPIAPRATEEVKPAAGDTLAEVDKPKAIESADAPLRSSKEVADVRGDTSGKTVGQRFGARKHLPVTSDGDRFKSAPVGSADAILVIADEVKRSGHKLRMSTQKLSIPNKLNNPWVNRYDRKFHTAGGDFEFSYYEGKGFRALGLHVGKHVVFDVFEGGAFTGPRLWGTYDQVLNDTSVQTHLLIGNGKDDRMGTLKASFVAGIITGMPKARLDSLGHIYELATQNVAAELGEGPVTRQAEQKGGRQEPMNDTDTPLEIAALNPDQLLEDRS